ncbi:MAG: fimbrillin family protein [Alistipes sp.]|nr:fimbrillin family protein [Alistipes sp.]
MKKILLSVFAVAALASCFQNEDIVSTSDNNAIKFDSYVGNTTKAIDPSLNNSKINECTLYVWGTTQQNVDGAATVSIFEGVEVSKATGVWKYADEHTAYWIDGNIYNFAAVVNGTVTGVDNGLPKTISYTTQNLEDQLDLLYAEAKDIKGEDKGNVDGKVAFTFDHLLSKAVFSFENTTPAPATGVAPQVISTVSNVRIKGLSSSGVYTVGADWGTTNTSLTENFGDIVAADANQVITDNPAQIAEQGKGKSNYERLLIPGTYSVEVICTIKLYLNGAVDNNNLAHEYKDHKITVNNLKLEPGHSYNFALSAGLNDQILFNVTRVNGWENGNTHDSDDDDTVNDHYPVPTPEPTPGQGN